MATKAPGGRPNKIRAASLEGVVRKLATEGLGYTEISDELKRRGHDIARSAVGRFLSEEAGERREAARNVAAEMAHDTVPLVTKKLRSWVEEIDGLIRKTIDACTAEQAEGDEEFDRDKRGAKVAAAVARASGSISTLVNAGTKAAKTLHDITVGDAPGSSVDVMRSEALEILAAKRKREAAEEQLTN